jgi:hypothetical protein
LTPAEDRLFVGVLLGNRDKRPGHPAATDTERQLAASLKNRKNSARSNAGMTLMLVAADCTGTLRPLGSRYDIGAFEDP